MYSVVQRCTALYRVVQNPPSRQYRLVQTIVLNELPYHTNDVKFDSTDLYRLIQTVQTGTVFQIQAVQSIELYSVVQLISLF